MDKHQKLWDRFLAMCKEEGCMPEPVIVFKKEVVDGMRTSEKALFSQVASIYFSPTINFQEIPVQAQPPITPEVEEREEAGTR